MTYWHILTTWGPNTTPHRRHLVVFRYVSLSRLSSGDGVEQGPEPSPGGLLKPYRFSVYLAVKVKERPFSGVPQWELPCRRWMGYSILVKSMLYKIIQNTFKTYLQYFHWYKKPQMGWYYFKSPWSSDHTGMLLVSYWWESEFLWCHAYNTRLANFPMDLLVALWVVLKRTRTLGVNTGFSCDSPC